MLRPNVLLLGLFTATACASRVSSSVAAPAVTPETRGRGAIPSQVGHYRLTRVEAVKYLPADTLYRFTDGSASILTVIRYSIPEDVKIDADSQVWTTREGEKFERIQQVLLGRGSIESYRTFLSHAQSVELADTRLMEHATVLATRRQGTSTMDFQYLYLVGGRFLKVRGTFFGEQWQTSEFPAFARELARRVSLASK